MIAFTVRSLHQPEDRGWLPGFMKERWGSEQVICHGEVFYPASLPGFAAEQDGELAGLVTYQINGKGCEVITLDSLQPGQGIGTALINRVRAEAEQAGCSRLFLTTTNDNLHALRFYQKRGFHLCNLRVDAVTASRSVKPEIPLFGEHDIPIRDELELEILLDKRPSSE